MREKVLELDRSNCACGVCSNTLDLENKDVLETRRHGTSLDNFNLECAYKCDYVSLFVITGSESIAENRVFTFCSCIVFSSFCDFLYHYETSTLLCFCTALYCYSCLTFRWVIVQWTVEGCPNSLACTWLHLKQSITVPRTRFPADKQIYKAKQVMRDTDYALESPRRLITLCPGHALRVVATQSQGEGPISWLRLWCDVTHTHSTGTALQCRYKEGKACGFSNEK